MVNQFLQRSICVKLPCPSVLFKLIVSISFSPISFHLFFFGRKLEIVSINFFTVIVILYRVFCSAKQKKVVLDCIYSVLTEHCLKPVVAVCQIFIKVCEIYLSMFKKNNCKFAQLHNLLCMLRLCFSDMTLLHWTFAISFNFFLIRFLSITVSCTSPELRHSQI